MKKNITVNFFGSLYAIDEDAYELLKSYMDSLHDYFGRREGGEEIVNDLEARIAELLEELKRSGVQAVEISHVEQIIRRLGNPEEMAAEGGEADGGGEEKAESPRPEGTARKRLFRNPDDRMLGGVLSGVACYFGGDPLLWRLAMVAFFLLSGGTALLVYVVLWIVVPLARTPEEQLLMRGRPVTAGSLGEAVTAQARRAGQGGTRTEPAAPQGGTYGFFNGLLRVLTFVLKAFLYACAVCLLLGMLLLLCATLFPLFFGLVFSPFHWVEHWGDGEWLYTVSLSPAVGWTFVGALLVVLFVPAYCLLHKARRLGGRAPGMGYAQRVVWVVLWLLALVVLCYLTVGWVLPYFW